MLMRNFTKREKIVLLILVLVLLGGFYFLVIHYPVSTRLEEIESEKLMVEDETTVAIAKGQKYVTMKNELNEIFQLPFDKITVMPAYDNQTQLLYNYQTIFQDLSPDLRLGDVKIDGNIATRTVSFTVTVSDFESAKDFIKKLTSTGFRCLLQNITISPEQGDLETNSIKLSGNIVFYELVTAEGNK